MRRVGFPALVAGGVSPCHAGRRGPRFCRKPPSRVPPAPRSCALLAVQLRVRSELADLGVRAPQDLHRRLHELDAVMSRCTELAGGRAARSNSRAALTGEACGASPGSEGEGEAGLPPPHAGCHGNGKPGRRCGQASPTPCQSVQALLRPACPDRGSQKRRVSRARRRVTWASKAAADRDRGTRRSRPPVACARSPSISVSSGRHGASHAAFRASQSHVRYLGARPLSPGSVFGSPALADSQEEPR